MNGELPLIVGFREHCEKARALRNQYVGKRCKSGAGAIRPGKLPFFARVLSRRGYQVVLPPAWNLLLQGGDRCQSQNLSRSHALELDTCSEGIIVT